MKFHPNENQKQQPHILFHQLKPHFLSFLKFFLILPYLLANQNLQNHEIQ